MGCLGQPNSHSSCWKILVQYTVFQQVILRKLSKPNFDETKNFCLLEYQTLYTQLTPVQGKNSGSWPRAVNMTLHSHQLPGWKGSCISSAVCEYSWEIHDIHVPNHTEITRDTHLCARQQHATRALTGVTNIEFFMLHMALPSASTAQRR